MSSHYDGCIHKKKPAVNSRIFLSLIPILIIFLTACSEKPASFKLAPPSTTKVAQVGDDSVDYSGLQEFVESINDQYVDEGLNLFNGDAILDEIDQVALMSNLHQNGWNHSYIGREEIKEWLKDEINSNAQLVPEEYKLYGNYLSMRGVLYHEDQALDIELIEIPENSKISLLIYYILGKRDN